jgi:hypothetical protein
MTPTQNSGNRKKHAFFIVGIPKTILHTAWREITLDSDNPMLRGNSRSKYTNTGTGSIFRIRKKHRSRSLYPRDAISISAGNSRGYKIEKRLNAEKKAV